MTQPNQPEAEQAVVTQGVLLARDVFDFLMGEGPIDGTHFGDLNDGLPGRFWWRAILRAAERETPARLAALPSEPSEAMIEAIVDRLTNVKHVGLLKCPQWVINVIRALAKDNGHD